MIRIGVVAVVVVAVVVMFSCGVDAIPVTDGGSGPLMLPQMRPSARLILIILREKCKQWQQNGVSPLPYYCWELLGLKMNNRGQGRPSPQRLNSFYDSYASTVSADDRLRDYSAARDRGRPMP